ncbi:MAG: glycosyltransferase family 39 protein, partial [Alphaproteobacteria bacterium]
MMTAEALPAVEPAEPDHRPLGGGSLRSVVVLVAGLTAVRLYAAAVLGLSADEAYYWIWAKNLAFGYLDHPPMVAVLIRASISVFGDTEFGLRWLSVLLGAAASLGVWRLVIRLDGGEAAALAGAAMVQATLFLGAGALLVTPDTPLVLFWTLTLLVLVEIGRGGHGAWWLLAGAMVAASFQSKYSAVFLGAG